MIKKGVIIMVGSVILGGCGQINRALYEGESSGVTTKFISKEGSDQIELIVEGADNWTLYVGGSEETIDFKMPYHLHNGKNRDQSVIFPLDRYRVFVLETEHGRKAVSLRHLPLEKGYNFRDMGGYQTMSSQYVKWGKVFRADELGELNESDLDILASVPIRTVVDFRSPDEVTKSPDKLPVTSKGVNLAIVPGNLGEESFMTEPSKEKFVEIMRHINRLFVTDSTIIDQYREFFALLQNEDNIPLLFHCTAGKDRTGLAAALFLSALGVDREIIYEDYLLSNRHLEDKYAPLIAANPEMESLFTVDRSYLESAFETIEETYDSVEKFLTRQLNVDIDKLRQLYLN